MDPLTPARRRELRAAAHHLHPVVAIGSHGLTPAVLHEIDVALAAHELIKLRVQNDDRERRESLLARVCAELGCVPVQHLGKLLILWRERKKPVPDESAARPRAIGRRRGFPARPAAARGAAPVAASQARADAKGGLKPPPAGRRDAAGKR
ncbi:MAG: YhbY family RNA-binding protein, partial [Casimicrobiaceae bacterium]